MMDTNIFLDKLKLGLEIRNFSAKTVKSYTKLVRKFLEVTNPGFSEEIYPDYVKGPMADMR